MGTDVLVHEVIAPDLMRGRGGSNTEAMERVIEHHTIPEKAGEVFARANPRLAVYSHIIPVTAAADYLIPPTRKTYPGPLEIHSQPGCQPPEVKSVGCIGEQVTKQSATG